MGHRRLKTTENTFHAPHKMQTTDTCTHTHTQTHTPQVVLRPNINTSIPIYSRKTSTSNHISSSPCRLSVQTSNNRAANILCPEEDFPTIYWTLAMNPGGHSWSPEEDTRLSGLQHDSCFFSCRQVTADWHVHHCTSEATSLF